MKKVNDDVSTDNIFLNEDSSENGIKMKKVNTLEKKKIKQIEARPIFTNIIIILLSVFVLLITLGMYLYIQITAAVIISKCASVTITFPTILFIFIFIFLGVAIITSFINIFCSFTNILDNSSIIKKIISKTWYLNI
jgi:hypothetical protein